MTTLIMTKDDVIDVDSGNDELVSPQKETVLPIFFTLNFDNP